jgi:hypothetical protein
MVLLHSALALISNAPVQKKTKAGWASTKDSDPKCGNCTVAKGVAPGKPDPYYQACMMEGGNCIKCVEGILGSRCKKELWPNLGNAFVKYPQGGMFIHGTLQKPFHPKTDTPSCSTGGSEQNAMKKFYKDAIDALKDSSYCKDGDGETPDRCIVPMTITKDGKTQTVDVVMLLGHGTLNQVCGKCALIELRGKYGMNLMVGTRAWSFEISDPLYMGAGYGGGCNVPNAVEISCDTVLDAIKAR